VHWKAPVVPVTQEAKARKIASAQELKATETPHQQKSKEKGRR
jgi:hypothetical protein